MTPQVKDELGNVYASLSDAIKTLTGNTATGRHYMILRERGFLNVSGHRLFHLDSSPQMQQEFIGKGERDLLQRLKQRYSDDELARIARGEGLDFKGSAFPAVHLEGEHHRILVMSDTHIGSVYAPDEWHDIVSGFANDPANNVECILHCGDIVEGMKIARAGTQIYELNALGFEAQRDKAVLMMSKYRKPIYIISGNHDMFFKEYAGADIVRAIESRVPNMTYAGYDSADIEVGGCII